MQYTKNLNLKKPDQNDYVNIADINENMDVLDESVQKKYEKPNTGISKTDLSQPVQDSLVKADNAATQTGLDLTNEALATHQVEYEQHKSSNVVHDTYASCATTGATAEKVVTVNRFTLVEGARITVKFANVNTAITPTLKINAEVAKPIVKSDGTAFKNIKDGVYSFVYSGVNFTVQGEGGEYGTATGSDVVFGKTIGTEDGLVNGIYSNIKSMQVAKIDYKNRTSYTLDINPVNVSKSIMIANVTYAGNISNQPVVELINPTTITLTSISAYNLPVTVQVMVIEFNNVKNKLAGSITDSTNYTFNIDISTVNPSKCLAFGTVTSSASSSIANHVLLTVHENSLRVEVGAGPYSKGKIDWQILEFN